MDNNIIIIKRGNSKIMLANITSLDEAFEMFEDALAGMGFRFHGNVGIVEDEAPEIPEPENNAGNPGESDHISQEGKKVVLKADFKSNSTCWIGKPPETSGFLQEVPKHHPIEFDDGTATCSRECPICYPKPAVDLDELSTAYNSIPRLLPMNLQQTIGAGQLNILLNAVANLLRREGKIK